MKRKCFCLKTRIHNQCNSYIIDTFCINNIDTDSTGSDMKTKSIKIYRSVGGKKIKIVSSASSKKGISKRNKLTSKASDKSLEKGCEDTMCTNFVKETVDEEFIVEVIKNLKIMELEDPDLEKRKLAKKSMKNFIIEKKRMRTRKYRKRLMEVCKKLHCNPTCEGTVVDGIVEDGFNTKLHPMDVKDYKKEGAISGCLPLIKLC